MSPDVLEAICKKIFTRIAPDSAPTIIWHAGEPTAVPVQWYEWAHSVMRAYAPPGATFSMQSNGVALSQKWIEFLRNTGIRMGLSIDGPKRFHDARRKTRKGAGTWDRAIAGLSLLQKAGMYPSVVTVLQPEALAYPESFFEFYRAQRITHVSFSIDEAEGHNFSSSFSDGDYQSSITKFQLRILQLALSERYPLHIKEVERVAGILTGSASQNEQVAAWDVVVVAADGNMTTFSPEFMEIESARHNNFVLGNIVRDDLDDIFASDLVRAIANEVDLGVERCRAECRYFGVCGGGAPANKVQETGTLSAAATLFCRLSVQPAAEALRELLQSQVGNSVNTENRGTPVIANA